MTAITKYLSIYEFRLGEMVDESKIMFAFSKHK